MILSLAVLSGFALALPAPLLARWMRAQIGWILALLPTGLFFFFLYLLLSYEIVPPLSVQVPWVPDLGLSFSLRADGLGLLFAVLITGIGAVVVVYAGSYLEGDGQLSRFFPWLMIFMSAMLGLVLADNLLLLYVFWELTSLSSYLLIGFEHHRPEARAAAWQALLVTGAGGLALLVGLVLLGMAGGTYEISALMAKGDAIRASPYYLPILILILLGALTKSAQFPFHFWLPRAMEAPTPVSAYLHSATMVKAGIYILARFFPVLGGTEVWQYSLVGVGMVTMLVGAYLALNFTDLKRILAYSTISALGTMVLLLGVGVSGAVEAAMVFLLAHALYKGALFLVAGILDHETGVRDVDRLGGLARVMPFTAFAAWLAALSFAGFGPVLGFIGKELIFETVLEAERGSFILTPAAVLAGGVNVAVALIVAIRPFLGQLKPTPKHPHRAPVSLWSGPAVMSVFGMVLGLLPASTAQRLVAPAVTAALGEPFDFTLALWHGFNLALALSAVSIGLGILAYVGWQTWRQRTRPLERILSKGPEYWYDQALVGMNALARGQTRLLQSGTLSNYLLIVVVTTVILVGLTLLATEGVLWSQELFEIRFYEAALGVVILVATIAAVRSRSRLSAVAALGVTGYSVALIFLVFGAPDLAMTQFLIESLTVILFVFAFYHLPHFNQLTATSPRLLHVLISLSAGALMTSLVLSVVGIDIYPKISTFFVENALSLAHGRNIVNVILVDFRGLDTLGEITVLAVASVGVYALLKLLKGGSR